MGQGGAPAIAAGRLPEDGRWRSRTGLQVAIDRRASLVYDNLPAGGQPIARRIFLRLIQFGEGRVDTRRQQTVAELRASGDDPAVFDQTLARLTESRLLTASGDAEVGVRRVDIAHEALIAGWPRLQEWLRNSKEDEQTRRRLEEKAVEWLRLGQAEGGLLDEYELHEAEVWLASDDAQELGFTPAVQDLVVASREVLAQAKRDKAEAARNRQRSRFFAGGLVLAVAVITVVGWFWWQSVKARDTAESNERTAVSAQAQVMRLTRGVQADQLTANALKVVDENPPLALLLAAEGMRAQSDLTTTVVITEPVTPQSRLPVAYTAVISETVVASALTNVTELLQQVGGIPLTGHENDVKAVVFSPDGRWLATASFDNTAHLWDMNNLSVGPRTYSAAMPG